MARRLRGWWLSPIASNSAARVGHIDLGVSDRCTFTIHRSNIGRERRKGYANAGGLLSTSVSRSVAP